MNIPKLAPDQIHSLKSLRNEFADIPAERWCSHALEATRQGGIIQRCAFGHAAFMDTGNASPQFNGVHEWTPRLKTLHDITDAGGVCPSCVNNGDAPEYQQDNERARVLAYFDDIIKGQ